MPVWLRGLPEKAWRSREDGSGGCFRDALLFGVVLDGTCQGENLRVAEHRIRLPASGLHDSLAYLTSM